MIPKEHRTGILKPVVDRTKCEGGFHNECKEQSMPCLAACHKTVLEVRKLKGPDKAATPFGRIQFG